MIAPGEFVDALVAEGFTRFTGVPCSFFQAAMNRVLDDSRLSYTIVPNEGSALAVASGSWLAGGRTAVLIQNSGFGNLFNPLTSLNMIYGIPVLVFMSGRAYGVPDEPQHEVVGKTMGATLDALGVAHADMPADAAGFRAALHGAAERIEKDRVPFFFFVRKDTIDEYAPEKKDAGKYPLTRLEAIRVVTETLGENDVVVATTGKPSRELFHVKDRARNFYMQGSMGHAASIGLGFALERPKERVVVLDGDGAVLMHLGALSSVGHYKPANLTHVVLDNESYETTGDQDTTSPTTDFARIALACGYKAAADVSDAKTLAETLKRFLASSGPSFLRVKINRRPTGGIPRISSKYSSSQIAANVRKATENVR